MNRSEEHNARMLPFLKEVIDPKKMTKNFKKYSQKTTILYRDRYSRSCGGPSNLEALGNLNEQNIFFLSIFCDLLGSSRIF